jgi:hypothetical protein
MPSIEDTNKDRFEHFTEDERFLIAEALRTHLATKKTVYDELRKDPLPSTTYSLSESDFGIPALTALLDENGY